MSDVAGEKGAGAARFVELSELLLERKAMDGWNRLLAGIRRRRPSYLQNDPYDVPMGATFRAAYVMGGMMALKMVSEAIERGGGRSADFLGGLVKDLDGEDPK